MNKAERKTKAQALLEKQYKKATVFEYMNLLDERGKPCKGAVHLHNSTRKEAHRSVPALVIERYVIITPPWGNCEDYRKIDLRRTFWPGGHSSFRPESGRCYFYDGSGDVDFPGEPLTQYADSWNLDGEMERELEELGRIISANHPDKNSEANVHLYQEAMGRRVELRDQLKQRKAARAA